MCRRIMMLIEAGDWKQANEKCEGMLDKYPEDEAFYFYKVIVGEHLGLDINIMQKSCQRQGLFQTRRSSTWMSLDTKSTCKRRENTGLLTQ